MKLNLLFAAAFASVLFPGFFLEAEEEPSVVDWFPENLRSASGEDVSREELRGKLVGIYFSAHWCPPCREFTPWLVAFHEKHAGEDFEVVLVSFDDSNREKAVYMAEEDMGFLTLPGSRNEAGNALAEKFRIPGFPTLVILGPDGSLVTPNGREDVSLKGDDAFEDWKAQASGEPPVTTTKRSPRAKRGFRFWNPFRRH